MMFHVKRFFHVLALRWQIGDLEVAVRVHHEEAARAYQLYGQAQAELRRKRARLALLDCPARALRDVMGRRLG